MNTASTIETYIYLLRSLSDKNLDTRRNAFDTISEYDPTLIPMSARLLIQDPSPGLRRVAVEALGDYGSKHLDVGRLGQAVTDKNWTVRSSAATSLGRFPNKASFAFLSLAIQDKHYAVRRDAAIALRNFGVSAISVLTNAEMLEKNEISLIGIYYSLFCIGQKGRMAQLLDFLKSGNFLTCDNVINVIDPNDLTQSESAIVKAKVGEYIGIEKNLGNKGDALSLLQNLAVE